MCKPWHLLIAVVLLCLSPGAAALQPDKAFHDYVHGHWSIQDGLPQVSVSSIAQDRRGYLWVGTQSGLARFDGVHFRTYTPATDAGLPGISIQALTLARDGVLWVGTYKGVAVHDGSAFSALSFDDSVIAAPAVNAFAEDAQGRMWVATDDGVFRTAGRTLRRVEAAPAQSRALLAAAGAMWVGGRGEVWQLRDGHWMRETLGDNPTVPPEVNRLALAQGRLWAATTAGLYVRGDTGWQRFDAGSAVAVASIEMLRLDRDGNLWAGGDIGLLRIRDGQLRETVLPGSVGSVPALRAAFEDREGSLWLGSRTDGLVRLRDSWTRRFSVSEGLHDRVVWTVSPDPDGVRVWVGGDGGISVLERGRFTQVAAPAALSHPQPYNLLAEQRQLWIGTRRGLSLMDTDGPSTSRITQPAWLAPLAGAQINGLLRVADGSLWITSSDGVFHLRIDPESGVPRLRRYGQDEGLADPRVRVLLQRRDGRLVAGSQDGLFVLHGDRFERIGADAGLPAMVDVTSLAQLDDGRMLVGTLSEVTYVSSGAGWRALDAIAGLPANAAFYMVAHRGYVWSAGIRGISRVPLTDVVAFADGKRKAVRGEMLLNERGDSRSGQQGYCCNGAGNAKGFLRGDTLWLPSRDGVVAFDTASIVKNPVPPTAVIERMQTGNDWLPASQAAGMTLAANLRDVAFEYTILSLQDPPSVGIEYRLRGYDREWQAGDPIQRAVRYTNLSPGDYVFDVRGSNNAGVASLADATLAFSIAPRFYETAWFKALLVLLLVVLVFVGYREQRRRYRNRNQALELLVSQRTAALEAANASLLEASITDPLTGLRNRRYVARQILADLSHYERRAEQGGYRGEVIACALVDLDHFKQINDTHGHAAGDSVLVDVAQVLTGLVRSADYVVRWGGEEFLLLFRPMPAHEVPLVGERLCSAVAAHTFALGNGDAVSIGRVTCSVGISQYPLMPGKRSAVRLEQLVELADRALYRVKSGSRNGWSSLATTKGSDAVALIDALRGHADRCVAEGQLQWIGSGIGEPQAEETIIEWRRPPD